MMFGLLILDAILWYWLYRANREDKSNGPYPENETFDWDMDRLGKLESLGSINSSSYNDKLDDIAIKQYFESTLQPTEEPEETEPNIDPEKEIWCNGYKLRPLDPEDMKRFMEIKNRANLRGDYNSVPLDDGGEDLIYRDWFRMKGCSLEGAESLINQGYKPWEYEC